MSEVPWPSTMFPEPETPPDSGTGGPPSFGSLPRPTSGDAALDDALVEADVFRRYGLVEKALDQLRPWLDRAPGNLRVREKLFEIFLEQGNRAEAREQAEILAEAYAVSGREDRIRGLEGLLGEPLRAVPPAEVEVPVAIVEPAAEEVVVAREQAEPTALEEPAEVATEEQPQTGTEEPVEEVVAASTDEPGEGQPLTEAEGEPTEPPVLAEVPSAVSQALEEPPTEVISAVIERVAVPPAELEAVAPEEPAAVLPEPQAEPEAVLPERLALRRRPPFRCRRRPRSTNTAPFVGVRSTRRSRRPHQSPPETLGRGRPRTRERHGGAAEEGQDCPSRGRRARPPGREGTEAEAEGGVQGRAGPSR